MSSDNDLPEDSSFVSKLQEFYDDLASKNEFDKEDLAMVEQCIHDVRKEEHDNKASGICEQLLQKRHTTLVEWGKVIDFGKFESSKRLVAGLTEKQHALTAMLYKRRPGTA